MLKRRFGQHFLSDPNILRRIVEFANVGASDTVVEIGPGAGSLTWELSRAAKTVIAIEIDSDLIEPLRDTLPANVEIIHGDALEIDFTQLTGGSFHVVGNLPYNVATPLFKRFIAYRRQILDVTVMIQKEVADRIVAKPNEDAYGPLSVLIQYYAEPQSGFTVKPGAFRPKPKVDSAVIRLQWRPDVEDSTPFTDFVHTAFGSRRKKLINNLIYMFPHENRDQLTQHLSKAGVPIDARPENLSVADFHRLYNQICRHR